jgi:hypothetical protein
MENLSPIGQVAIIIVGGIVAVVYLLAVLTNFFDKK